jgi:hypothetical protein
MPQGLVPKFMSGGWHDDRGYDRGLQFRAVLNLTQRVEDVLCFVTVQLGCDVQEENLR